MSYTNFWPRTPDFPQAIADYIPFSFSFPEARRKRSTRLKDMDAPDEPWHDE